MWEDSRYFWVVLCKNHWFHVRKNLFFRHKILLGETDAITPRPAIDQRFKVRCDECGKEYTYKLSEVLRVEQEPPEGFTRIHSFEKSWLLMTRIEARRRSHAKRSRRKKDNPKRKHSTGSRPKGNHPQTNKHELKGLST